MSFTLQLAQDLVEVEAGATVPVTFVVTDRGTTADRYELEVQGLDGEWTAVPVPTFTVEVGETHTERFFLKPPRTSESIAGNYPFVVRVRSLESGEQKTAQGVLRLKAFNHLTAEINPKRGMISPFVKRNTFAVSLMNLGNTEHTIQLIANDPEDRLTFEFENEQVTLGPGQQKEIEVTATPTTTRIFSSSRLIGFSVTGRSTTATSVVTTAQAQLEQKSLITATSLVVTLLLALLVFAWTVAMPKNPGVSLTVSSNQVVIGQRVKLSWQAHDASRIVIQVSGGETIYDGPELSGSREYEPKTPGALIFEAVPSRDKQTGSPSIQQVNFVAPVESPIPVISEFKASATKVKVGSPVTFTWSVQNAVKVVITPRQGDLSPDLQAFQVESVSQPTDFALVAFNKDGRAVRSKTIHVDTYEESDATIVSFDSTATEVHEEDGGKATLSWWVENAAVVKLAIDKGPAEKVESNDKLDVTLTAKTSYVLTAFDKKGRQTSKTITIDFKKAVLPKPDEASGPTGTPGTGPQPAPTSGPVGVGGN